MFSVSHSGLMGLEHQCLDCLTNLYIHGNIKHVRFVFPYYHIYHDFMALGGSPPGGGGYSTLGWVRMCGPKFRPPPYNKTREDANLQPITKPFASWRTLFKTNQYFLPYKLGCISTFWQPQPIGKLKGKIQRKLCILQKCDRYLNQFSNKKGAIGKPERPKKHPIWAAHPRTTFPLSTPRVLL